MSDKRRYACPRCGFAVFNRRFPKCERCAAPLPDTLKPTPGELALLAAESAKNEAVRKDMAREAEQLEQRRQRDAGFHDVA